MFKKIIAATALIACAGAFAFAVDTATLAKPAAGVPSAATAKRDPAMFAKHNDELIAQRVNDDTCTKAAADGKALMGCLKSEHEAMKADHPRHQEGRHGGYDEGRHGGYDEGRHGGYDEGRHGGYGEGRHGGYGEGEWPSTAPMPAPAN